MNGRFSDELRSPRVSVCDGLPVYASTKTLVRPCSSKKLLIHGGIAVQDAYILDYDQKGKKHDQ
jgi:hypothetical protein